MVAVSLIWDSFCLMNEKGYDLLKMTRNACRVNWTVLMSFDKAGIVPEAA